jgi:hypothetical protein
MLQLKHFKGGLEMKRLLIISAVLLLTIVTTSVAYALPSDNFNDNSLDTSLWYLYEFDPNVCWMEETNQRLEMRTTSAYGDEEAICAANGWGLLPTNDFSFKTDFHFSANPGHIDSDSAIGLGLANGGYSRFHFGGVTHLEIEAGCYVGGDGAHPYFDYYNFVVSESEKVRTANDEIDIPFYGKNSTGEKIEYGRLVIKFTGITAAAEASQISLMKMIAGTLTSIGELIGTSGTQTLTNKTINCPDNTVTNIRGNELANIAATGGVPVIFTATLTSGNTVQIHNANAPFKYRIINAWSVATSNAGGTWKLTDGTNDITNAVAVTATDKTINNAGTIDDAYHEINANGSLSVVGDGSLSHIIVYIKCIRVA